MSGHDILFVTPPSRVEVYQSLSGEFAALEPPVWSGLIAEFIRRRGFEVAMLDAEAKGLTHEETARLIAAADPELVVFSVYGQQPSASTQCMPAAGKTCRLLRRLSDRPVMVLGTHPSALPKRTMEEEAFDFVCQGEGPYTVLGLIEAIKAGRDPDRVPGLWWRDRDGDIRSQPMAAKIKDLDGDLPRQAWDLLDMSLYRAHNWHCFGDLRSRGSYASLQTSLGCPYKCTFCCINAPFGGNGIRYWSAEAVIRQIDELVERYGVRNIKIPDEMFVLNKRHVIGICDAIIERGYDLNIWAYARIDTVQDEFLDKLKRAGFNWLGVGIESASAYVRDGVVKGKFTDTEIARTVRRIRNQGIYVGANYIFGLPDDTLASMQATLDLALELNTEWANFYCAMAYPGSALYPLAKERGWALPDDPGGPGWIGYSQHAVDMLPLPTDTLPATTVIDFRDEAFMTYFGAPHYADMVRATFGDETVDHIRDMTKVRLKRRHHDRARELSTVTT